MKATLALENGLWYEGDAAGAAGETGGEVVFNTSMTGYQEVLTDPSYAGQIVTMTAPEIGNYGVAPEDVESRGTAGRRLHHPRGVADRQQLARRRHAARLPGREQHRRDLRHRHARADARAAIGRRHARHHRDRRRRSARARRERAQALPPMEGSDLVLGVTCDARVRLAAADASRRVRAAGRAARSGALRVAAYDFGMKWNILRRFTRLRLRRARVSGDAPASELLAAEPGRRVPQQRPRRSGGARLRDRQRAGRSSTSDVPVFGICLGHQILALAMGGDDLQAEVRPSRRNHPVKDLETGKVEITSQNHGFAVDPESLPRDVKVTHVNLYDGTVEGLRHETQPVFCVQYHPEASPGPHDADYLFRQFVEEMERATRNRCPSVLISSAFSSSAPARSSSGRRASSTTPARRRARRCRPKGSRSCSSTATRRRS